MAGENALKHKTAAKSSAAAPHCPQKVIVIGGGVAGLTAAHELQERGFQVVIYERNTALGGKARSFIISNDTKEAILGKVAQQNSSDPNKTVADAEFETGPTAKDRLSAVAGLPAEHGYRFLPSFYKHLADTLSRIPCCEAGHPVRYVSDNLIDIPRAAYARRSVPFFHFSLNRPNDLHEWFDAIYDMFRDPFLGVPIKQALFATFRIMDAMTMCQKRREKELDNVSWWDYMKADAMSQEYRSIIVNGLTDFVAMDAKHSGAKPVVNVIARLLNDYLRPGGAVDRVFTGPTSEVWIDRWVDYLKDTNILGKVSRCGQIPVTFFTQKAVRSLSFNEADNEVTAIELSDGTEEKADYFVAAAPIEAMIEILENTVAKSAEFGVRAKSLAQLRNDALKTSWLTGIMFYLKEDVTMETGHVFYLDSKWELTSISQNQFWSRKVQNYHGEAHGILSALISDWWTISPRICKTAEQTDNQEELAEETLAQIRDHLHGRTLASVDWANIAGFYLNPALIYRETLTTLERLNMLGLMPAHEFSRRKKVLMEDKNRRVRSESPPFDFVSDEDVFDVNKDELKDYIDRDLEPMFINTVGSWQARPDARTKIDNLFLASDYVKTNTDLASMEGANEAARRAVNSLLDQHEQPQVDKITQVEDIGKRERKLRRCEIFEFDEPAVFAPLRALDETCYERGYPHPPLFDTMAHFFRIFAPPFLRSN